MLYALDIETNTGKLPDGTQKGLDPTITEITSIAILGGDGSIFVADSPNEESILRPTFAYIGSLHEGTLVTWNGAVFDFPFIYYRADLYGLHDDPTLPKLKLELDPTIEVKYQPLNTFQGGYKVEFGRLGHVDVMHSYRTNILKTTDRSGLRPLKPTARENGIEVIEVDRENMDSLTPMQRTAYVLSDVNATLIIAYIAGVE